ncbi:acyl-CoA dehydrogenase family protein [Saxibacter everestensis]|uniref:Acyl-CoA dehydrogenase family protein n=1 Tax=Saxibacter everestensis TaxID=2909229 RepID=A0ABY8QTL7_9MICO|nr:acyl-CoA dehydrogenase family protein [Brevibacteriaceae bacterium ZFBP1038]
MRGAEVVGDLRQRISAGELELPRPGEGSTLQRWRALAELTRSNVVLGRLAEGHADADAILHELGGSRTWTAAGRDQLWGVWAAEPPRPRLSASRAESGELWRLDGTKLWCSGAHHCTHALVTASVDADPGASGKRLFAVDLRQPGIRAVPDSWHAVGMAASDSGAVEFSDAVAEPVGVPGGYVNRPGFWQGGIGVAACWYGGATGVADTLFDQAGRRDDDLTRAHLGAVQVSLGAAWAVLEQAATAIDEDPKDERGTGKIRAFTARATAESSAATVIDHVGRALGAGPLCSDPAHAGRVADLGVYIRQSHAERDLAELGSLLVEGGSPW